MPGIIENNEVGSKLNERLSLLMERNGISLTVLYRNTGIAIPTIKRMQSDKTCNPTVATLLPIAAYFGITLNQLIGVDPLPLGNIGFFEEKSHWLRIPIVSWKDAIDWPEIHIAQYEFTQTDIDIGKKPYALKIETSDWMFSGFLKNSLLLINTEINPAHKDYVVVHKADQELPTLKQILIDENQICLKPLTPYFSPTALDATYRLCGVVVQISNTLKG